MINKAKTIFFISILGLNLSANELSLNDLIDIALNNNSKIVISKNQKNIRENELEKVKSAYLPQVSANLQVGEYRIDSNNTIQDGSSTTASISANQLIYDFGKTSSSIDASKYNLEASSSDINSSIQETVLSIKQAYFDILNKHQQINVAKEAIKIDELQLSQAKEYFKAGVRTQIDVTNAQLKLSNSKLELLQKEYDLKISTTKLISLLGKRIDSNVSIKRDNQTILELAKNRDLKYSNLEKLINKGIQNRDELKKYEYIIKTNQANIKNVDSQYYPRIDLSASYTDQNSNDIPSIESEQAAVIVGLKWDIFTGNSTKSEKEIAFTKLKNTQKEFEQKKLEITQEITSSYFNLKQSFESIEIGLLNLQLATKNLDLATQRYKAGLNDLLEVNDAKLEYTQSKSNLVNIYYNYLTDIAQLEYSLGINYLDNRN